jgi:hypothetical protein
LSTIATKRNIRNVPESFETLPWNVGINELEQRTINDHVVEAAHTLLGFDKAQEEWSRQDYARALQERFRCGYRRILSLG